MSRVERTSVGAFRVPGLMQMFLTVWVCDCVGVASSYLHSPSGRVERQRGEGQCASAMASVFVAKNPRPDEVAVMGQF
jgi:hypothetical protein